MRHSAALTVLACVMASVLVSGSGAGAGSVQAAPSASAAKAKEFAALMAEKKLESFAAKISENRYVAVFVVPNLQMLLVSAIYSRSNDIEYSIYHKQYSNAYQDLRSGVFASERFLIDDAQLDGLVSAPGKNPQQDAVTVEKERVVFDGQHGDGKGRNAKKPLTEVYMKSFADADAKYGQLLDVLIQQLKAAKLDASGTLR